MNTTSVWAEVTQYLWNPGHSLGCLNIDLHASLQTLKSDNFVLNQYFLLYTSIVKDVSKNNLSLDFSPT